jgi:adenylate cyclase
MPQVHCLPDDQVVEISRKDTLLLGFLSFGVPHTAVCGGNARCTTCRVRIIDGLTDCAPRSDAESRLAQRLGFPEDIRLACQLRVQGDVKVRRLVVDHFDIAMTESQLQGGAVGAEKLVAIMFADIRGFTSRSEKMLPYDVIYLLNCYFNQVGKAIGQHGGMINTYMGDGFMALFGCDERNISAEEICLQAVRGGLAVLEQVALLNQHLDTLADQPLRVGIGIHFGQVVVGKIGTAEYQVTTAIGDAVNFASRIESANKVTGTQLLVSQAVWDMVTEKAVLASAHRISIAGKSGEYNLYAIADVVAEVAQIKPNWLQRLGTILQTKIF